MKKQYDSVTKEKTRFYRGHVPYQGGGFDPPHAFFRQNVKNIRHALKNFFYVNNFSVLSPLNSAYSLSTGSNKIFIKE